MEGKNEVVREILERWDIYSGEWKVGYLQR
jgi:hypothetical protein